jgi:hypothetical protein
MKDTFLNEEQIYVNLTREKYFLMIKTRLENAKIHRKIFSQLN